MPISKHLLSKKAPSLYSLFDEDKINQARRMDGGISALNRVQKEMRARVEEIFIPLKVKKTNLCCETCNWRAPHLKYLVLHHQKKRKFSSIFYQYYYQQNPDLDNDVEVSYFADWVVREHKEEELSLICKECHVFIHSENRFLFEKTKKSVDEVKELKRLHGFKNPLLNRNYF